MIINTLRKKIFVKKNLNLIHNLRYLLFLFLFSIFILLTCPKLFKHVNKIQDLNSILKNQHGFVVKKTENVEYKIFPRPHLEIGETFIILNENLKKVRVNKLKIFTNLKGLYFSDQIFFKKVKFEIDYSGFKINGYYIPQKEENLLYFKVKNLGIETKVFLNKKKIFPKTSGLIKLKVLDNNLLMNFNYDQSLNFYDTVFKNKNLLGNFEGQLDFEPFFYFKVFVKVKKINAGLSEFQKIYQIIIDEIAEKKLNGELYINFLTKKSLGKKKVNIHEMNLTFNNGDIISKKTSFQFTNLNIKLNFFLKRYPLYKNLEYDVVVKTDNINKFLKVIDTKKNINFKKMKLFIKGRVNLDAQKYYFNKILINENNIEEKDLDKLKSYFDENLTYYLNSSFDEENIYLFLKNLIEFI